MRCRLLGQRKSRVTLPLTRDVADGAAKHLKEMCKGGEMFASTKIELDRRDERTQVDLPVKIPETFVQLPNGMFGGAIPGGLTLVSLRGVRV